MGSWQTQSALTLWARLNRRSNHEPRFTSPMTKDNCCIPIRPLNRFAGCTNPHRLWAPLTSCLPVSASPWEELPKITPLQQGTSFSRRRRFPGFRLNIRGEQSVMGVLGTYLLVVMLPSCMSGILIRKECKKAIRVIIFSLHAYSVLSVTGPNLTNHQPCCRLLGSMAL